MENSKTNNKSKKTKKLVDPEVKPKRKTTKKVNTKEVINESIDNKLIEPVTDIQVKDVPVGSDIIIVHPKKKKLSLWNRFVNIFRRRK